MRGMLIRGWLVSLVVMLWAAAVSGAAQGQTKAQAKALREVEALNERVEKLVKQNKHTEAEPLAKRALETAEKRFGSKHPAIVDSLDNLAGIYEQQRRFAEAEQLYSRSLELNLKAYGPDDLLVGYSLLELASVIKEQGRYADALPYYKRSLAVFEKADPEKPTVWRILNSVGLMLRNWGNHADAEEYYLRSRALREKMLDPEDREVGQALLNLGALYEAQGRYSEAEPLYDRALAIYEKAYGPDNEHVATVLNNLGTLNESLGRYAEAEKLYKRSRAIREKALGPDHPDVAGSLNNLAHLYQVHGRYTEAEPLFKRSLELLEKAYGPEHSLVATAISNLASLYEDQVDTSSYSEALHKRALEIRLKVHGPDHLDVANSHTNLGVWFDSRRRYAEAEPHLSQALAIRQKALGPDHPDVAAAHNNLAALYDSMGRYAEAEAGYKLSLALRQKALGPDHPDVSVLISNLAHFYRDRERYAEAEPLFEQSLAMRQKALGPYPPDVDMLYSLGVLHFRQRNWARVAELLRSSTRGIIDQVQRGGDKGDDKAASSLTKSKHSEESSYRGAFQALTQATYRLDQDRKNAGAGSTGEMFQAAQWAQGSEAASSLAQMAARGAAGDPRLSGLVRERQDLLAEWQKREGYRIVLLTEPADKQTKKFEASNTERLAAIEARIGEIDKRFKAEFPGFAELSRPDPLTIEQVQADLRPDEALVLFMDMEEMKPLAEETFVWVVTKTDARWVRSDLGSAALKREVAALRCGLDGSSWDGEGAKKCAEALGLNAEQAPGPAAPLPFDHARAHKLYTALLGEVRDLIKDKHLLLVPSGALTELPFQVLVTEPPQSGDKSGDHRQVAWLARSHALTVLPAVPSLKALRRLAKTSAATKPMIGFGNPLLQGDNAYRAALARRKQDCSEIRPEPAPTPQQVAGLSGRAGTPMATRGGQVEVASVRKQAPLPETADELCAVARDLKAEPEAILLGAHATEAEIKRLSASGELARYRIVHFATHGLLSGQLSNSTEPGLILTPPDKATDADDGYLTASEIAALKLDADWVILSACNTAGGDGSGAEALGGLARAFFYAHARALLVSHWAVKSEATVALITGAVGAIGKDPSVGRAEAMRRAMLTMIDQGKPQEAHPSYWAPFIVVGEGAAPARN